MARPKAFDPDAAVDRALTLFWERGYNATSIQDLVEGLHINRGSLYDTFGDKKALFLLALQRYQQQSNQQMITTLTTIRPVQEAIGHILQRMVDEAGSPTGRRGCLMVNTSTELAPHDADVQQMVQDNRAIVVGALRQALHAGQARGELAPTADPAALASLVFATMQGVRVMAKQGSTADELAVIVKTARQLIQ